MPLTTRLPELARLRPKTLAATIGGQRWTFAELWQAVKEIDASLGVLPSQDRPVGISLPTGGRLVLSTLGNDPRSIPLIACALSTGHAVALVGADWPVSQVQQVAEMLLPDLIWHRADQPEYAHLPNTHSGPLPPAPLRSMVVPSSGNCFLVGFTSGTTSAPKGFARTRESWRASLDAGHSAFALSPSDHTLAPGPLAHGITLYALAETWDAGATFHGMTRFDQPAVAGLLMTGDIKRFVGVPTMLETLSARQSVFEHVSTVTTAGAKLRADGLVAVGRTFPNACINEYYGASELGFVTLAQHGRDAVPADSVGRAFPHVTLAVRDGDKDLPQGGIGSIWVKGDLAIDAYLGGASGAFERRNGWASVGDIGRLDSAGNLTLVGRAGGMVTTGGHNVYLSEVEEAMRGATGILDAHVLAFEDAFLGVRLVGIVAGRTDGLSAHMATHLPRHKIPRRCYRMDTLPRTGSGKIASNVLRQMINAKDPRLERLPSLG